MHQVGRRPADDGERALLASRFAPLAVGGPSAAGIVATTQRPLVFEATEDYRHHGDEVVPDRSTGHTYIPLVIAGRTIGTIGLGFESFRPFPAEVLQALMTFATQAALAVERVRLLRAQGEALTALALSATRTAALQTRHPGLRPLLHRGGGVRRRTRRRRRGPAARRRARGARRWRRRALRGRQGRGRAAAR